MARRTEPPTGEPLRVSDLLELLPRIAELGPLVERLASDSIADPARRWTGSGELGSLASRLVDPQGIPAAAAAVSQAEADRLGRLYRRVAEVITALSQGRRDAALALLIEQGADDERLGRHGIAERCYTAASRIARDLGHARTAEAIRLSARAARSAGELAVAEARYEEAWDVAGRIGATGDAIVAATGRGNVAVDRGRWNDAREWYERALGRVSRDEEPVRERWQLLQNLAIVARRSGRLGEARVLLERAEREARRLGDSDAEVEIGNGWGQLLLAEGNAREAEIHLGRALELARSASARVAIAVNLGEALLAQGRSLEAGERAREAEGLALTQGVPGRLPEVYRLLAAVARARGEGDAFVLLEQALALVGERNLPPFEEALTREAYGDLRLREGDVERGIAELRAAARIFTGLGAEQEAARLEDRIARAAPHRGGDA